MFSRPVSSGWKPVPTSSRLATRPAMVTRPSLGSVMRDRIFSSVDLPAPLRPMMPSTSPRLTSKLTSFSAQNSSVAVAAHDGAAAQPCRPSVATHCAPSARQHVAQGRIALALGLVADDVFLAEPLGADDDIGLGHQIRSAKLRSVRRK